MYVVNKTTFKIPVAVFFIGHIATPSGFMDYFRDYF